MRPVTYALVVAVSIAAPILLLARDSSARGQSGAPGQLPPANVSSPTISGAATAGQTLSADPGEWDGPGLKFIYAWLRCDTGGGSCEPVAGADDSQYLLSQADVGSTMRVVVTGTNQNGTSTAFSDQTAVVGAPVLAPPALAPSNTALPTISGTPQQGETLVASPGGWSGTTPMSYAYQWQRCDLSGGSCAQISGATATSYVLTSADVGSTVRVSVAATNSAGSASATSAATAAVTAQITSWSGAYYAEQYDGSFSLGAACDYSQVWHIEPCAYNPVSWVDGVSNQAVRFTNCAASSPGICTNGITAASTESDGQLAGVDAGCDYAHAGWVAGSGTCGSGGYGKEEDTWYRFRLRFPTGYAPTPGTQNSIFELHVDDKSNADAKTHGYTGAYSVELGVQGQGNVSTSCAGSPMLCTTPGSQPRFFMQIPGGSYAIYPPDFFPLALNSLMINHWYDVVLHIYWSPDPSKGHVEWWLDGSKVLDVYTPTLYKRTDGTLSYGENIETIDYRLWANWAASLDFDQLLTGPTASSVGFTP